MSVLAETLRRQAQLQRGELGAAGCEVGTGIVKALNKGAEKLFLVWNDHKNLEYISSQKAQLWAGEVGPVLHLVQPSWILPAV